MVTDFNSEKKIRQKRKLKRKAPPQAIPFRPLPGTEAPQPDQTQAQLYQIQMQLATLELCAELMAKDIYALMLVNADKINALGLNIDLSRKHEGGSFRR